MDDWWVLLDARANRNPSRKPLVFCPVTLRVRDRFGIGSGLSARDVIGGLSLSLSSRARLWADFVALMCVI